MIAEAHGVASPPDGTNASIIEVALQKRCSVFTPGEGQNELEHVEVILALSELLSVLRQVVAQYKTARL